MLMELDFRWFWKSKKSYVNGAAELSGSIDSDLRWVDACSIVYTDEVSAWTYFPGSLSKERLHPAAQK